MLMNKNNVFTLSIRGVKFAFQINNTVYCNLLSSEFWSDRTNILLPIIGQSLIIHVEQVFLIWLLK